MERAWYPGKIAVIPLDVTIQGLDEARIIMIISNKYEEITDKLLSDLKRGITLIDRKGAYSN